MKNFVSIVLMISFSLGFITCARIDNSSVESTWLDEQLIEKKRYDYVTIESIENFENLVALGHTKTEFGGYKKTDYNDYYLVKYDAFETRLWSEKLVGNDDESGISIICDSFGNIFLASYSRLDKDIRTNSYGYEMSLTKYNSYGIIQWTKKIGESFTNQGIGLAIDSFDDIYLTVYSKNLFFSELNLPDEENFLMKFNSHGIKKWIKKLESISSESFLDIWTDSLNHIHVTGFTDMNFDENLNFQENDIILVSYNSDGIKQ